MLPLIEGFAEIEIGRKSIYLKMLELVLLKEKCLIKIDPSYHSRVDPFLSHSYRNHG